MDLKLNGRVALVTGGASGIGRAIVRRFFEEGASVAFCARSRDKVETLENELALIDKDRVFGRVLDIRQSDDFKVWLESLPDVDIFVPVVSSLSQTWDDVYEIDIRANINCVDAVVPRMARSHCASITYIGSKVATYANTHFPVYSAAKACMVHYMKSLSLTLSSKGIRVNTVSPGDIYIKDGIWGKVKEENFQLYQESVSQSGLGRMGKAEEIADTVVFISSPRSSFTVGAHVIVDGGATQHL